MRRGAAWSLVPAAMAAALTLTPGPVASAESEHFQVRGEFEAEGEQHHGEFEAEREHHHGEFEAEGEHHAGGRVVTMFSRVEAEMSLRARGLEPGEHLFLVLRDADGHDTVITGFAADDRGRARLRFRNPARSGHDLTFDFDPRDKRIVVEDDAGDVMSTGVPSGGPPVPGNACAAVNTGDVFFVADGGAGKAKARFRREEDCDRDFRVEVEDVAPGSYEVCVAGTSYGTFQVVSNGVQVEGELELDNDADQPDDQPFPSSLADPLGQRIEVRQGAGSPCTGTLFFSFTSFPDTP